MQTIPNQKPKIVRCIFRAFVISIILFCVFYVAEYIYDFLGFKEIEYENSDHVIKIFEENESDFNSMATVLQRTNINRILFDDFMDNPRKFDPCPGDSLKNPKYQIKRRGFLKGKDYKLICSFFEKYGPKYIEGTYAFRFAFRIKDDIVYLFYIPNEGKDKVIDFLHNYTITHLKGEWYFAIYVSE